jgi:hypothetical protein
MGMTNYTQYIMDACSSGEINQYMSDRLLRASEFGMTDDLLQYAIDDAKDATKHEVESDDDYNVRFFVITTADDMMDDTFNAKLEPEDKHHLCKYILQNKKDGCKLKDLTDFRVLMHKWLCDKHKKTAYPNTFGKEDRDPAYDRYRWVDTIKVIYSLLHEKSIDKNAAIELATVDWSEDERFKFVNWMRYYESGNTEKYNVKTAKTKTAEPVDIYDLGLPSNMLDPATRSNNPEERPMSAYRVRKEKTKREQELEKAKKFREQMKSRLRSLRRLLDRYNSALPQQNIEQIQDEMYALDKSLSKLNVYASLEDCVVRSANRIERMGFREGADILHKFAADPEASPAPEALPPSPEDSKEIVEALPPSPESTKPPASSVDVNVVIQRLEGLTKALKSRDLIRDIASADILLNELGLASYFPELGDSQSKLIEAFSYAGNRVDAIVAKLRGTGKSVSKHPAAKEKPEPMPTPAPEPQSEKIDKRELSTKPIGRMRKELPAG